jgi:hypothetical protein
LEALKALFAYDPAPTTWRLAVTSNRKGGGPIVVDRQFVTRLDVVDRKDQQLANGGRIRLIHVIHADQIKRAVGFTGMIHETKWRSRLKLSAIFEVKRIATAILVIANNFAFDFADASSVKNSTRGEDSFADRGTADSQTAFSEFA